MKKRAKPRRRAAAAAEVAAERALGERDPRRAPAGAAGRDRARSPTPSTTGAPPRRRPRRARARGASSGRPEGPPRTSCVARPAIASVLFSKPRRAAPFAMSMAITTATPEGHAQDHEAGVEGPPDEVAQPREEERAARHQVGTAAARDVHEAPVLDGVGRGRRAPPPRGAVGGEHEGPPGPRVRRSRSVHHRAPGGVVEVAGGLVGEHEPRTARRGRGRWPRAAARRRRGGRGSRQRDRRGRPRQERASRARPSASRASAPASSAGSRTFSSAVRVGIRLKNWNTKPMWSRRKSVRSCAERRLRQVPSTKISPALGQVDARHEVQERALAAAAAPADGHELAPALSRRWRPGGRRGSPPPRDSPC